MDLSQLPGAAYKFSRTNRYLLTLHALMLRDLRTRWFGSYWGWFVQILWPVAHMFVISGAMLFHHMPSPMSSSTLIFAASGAVPALAFGYISRECMKGYSMNKPLTYYPQVKVFDVIVSRIVNETINSFAGVTVIFIVITVLGDDPIPYDAVTAIEGYLAAIFLGTGMGLLNVGILSVFPAWFLGYMGVYIALYLSSGVIFMACYLPEYLYSIAKWNPVLQVVEWVRLGYDPMLPIQIDKLYVVIFAACLWAVGLAMERVVVRNQN